MEIKDIPLVNQFSWPLSNLLGQILVELEPNKPISGYFIYTNAHFMWSIGELLLQKEYPKTSALSTTLLTTYLILSISVSSFGTNVMVVMIVLSLYLISYRQENLYHYLNTLLVYLIPSC